MTLVAAPLTAEAFAHFGNVLEGPALPGRVTADGALGPTQPALRPSLAIVLKPHASLPLRSTTMERHPSSSQTFIPLDAGPWLVIVAPDALGDGPDMARARAFLARPDQGVTYRAGVWHHPFTVLERPARFAVLMWKLGTSADDEFVKVAPFQIILP